MEGPFDAHGGLSHRVGYGTDGGSDWGFYYLFSVTFFCREDEIEVRSVSIIWADALKIIYNSGAPSY